jgi:hypothetical protein
MDSLVGLAFSVREELFFILYLGGIIFNKCTDLDFLNLPKYYRPDFQETLRFSQKQPYI